MHLSSRGGDCTGNKEQKGSRESLKHSSDEKRCINYTYFLGHVTCGEMSAGPEFEFTNYFRCKKVENHAPNQTQFCTLFAHLD